MRQRRPSPEVSWIMGPLWCPVDLELSLLSVDGVSGSPFSKGPRTVSGTSLTWGSMGDRRSLPRSYESKTMNAALSRDTMGEAHSWLEILRVSGVSLQSSNRRRCRLNGSNSVKCLELLNQRTALTNLYNKGLTILVLFLDYAEIFTAYNYRIEFTHTKKK